MQTMENFKDNFDMDTDSLPQIGDRRPIIKVIGVGGGGNNAINHMYKDRKSVV